MSSHRPSWREEVRADELAPGRIRRALRAWLGPLPASRDEVDDLVLAVDEAVANVVEHAYPGVPDGVVLVEAAVRPGDSDRADRVVVVVSDTGRWRPVPADPGSRGRGLAMMKAFTECLSVRSTGTGTRVTMACALIPSTRAPGPDPAGWSPPGDPDRAAAASGATDRAVAAPGK